jgi:hypothetical protein
MPKLNGGPTEILHCTSRDLSGMLRDLPSGGDLTELDQLKLRSFMTVLGRAAAWLVRGARPSGDAANH